MTSSSTTRCFGVVMISPWRVPALLLTAVILAWALAACGGGDGPDVEGGDAPRRESTETQATAMPEATTRPQATTPPTETQATAMPVATARPQATTPPTETQATAMPEATTRPQATTPPTETQATAMVGGRIAFESKRDSNWEIYVMNADGSGRDAADRRLGVGWLQPSWSPDGRRIAFVSDRDGDSSIWVMNADGSGRMRLTEHSGRDFEPS